MCDVSYENNQSLKASLQNESEINRLVNSRIQPHRYFRKLSDEISTGSCIFPQILHLIAYTYHGNRFKRNMHGQTL